MVLIASYAHEFEKPDAGAERVRRRNQRLVSTAWRCLLGGIAPLVFVLLLVAAFKCRLGSSWLEPVAGTAPAAPQALGPAAPCFVEGGVEFCLPTVVGVCCVRSGSTSLAEYLNTHPFLSYGTLKEHMSFRFTPQNGVGGASGGGGGDIGAEQESIRGLTWRQRLALGPPSARAGSAGVVAFLHGPDPGRWDFAPSDYTTTRAAAARALAPAAAAAGAAAGAEPPPRSRHYDRPVDPPRLAQFAGPLDEEKYARQFPWAAAGPGGAEGSAVPEQLATAGAGVARLPGGAEGRVGPPVGRARGGPVRFDFDPTYLGGAGDGASATALRSLLGPDLRLLLILRDPAHQAWSSL